MHALVGYVALSATDRATAEEQGGVAPIAWGANPTFIPFKDTAEAAIKAAVEAGCEVDTTWVVCKMLFMPKRCLQMWYAGNLTRTWNPTPGFRYFGKAWLSDQLLEWIAVTNADIEEASNRANAHTRGRSRSRSRKPPAYGASSGRGVGARRM